MCFQISESMFVCIAPWICLLGLLTLSYAIGIQYRALLNLTSRVQTSPVFVGLCCTRDLNASRVQKRDMCVGPVAKGTTHMGLLCQRDVAM